MKKYFYLLIFLLAVFIAKGQNVPNGGFEYWNNFAGYSTPVFWNTTDSVASTQGGQRSVLQDTVIVHGGHSAMKMQSWTYNGFLTEPGAATNGNLDVSSLAIVGGTPDSTRHDMLTGWYRFAPASDTCFVSVILSRWNGSSRDTVGSGRWSAYAVASSYTQFSIHLNYFLSGNPDTVLIVIASATVGIGTAHAGTVLYIDDLNFSGINGINDLHPNSFSVNAYPNPASNLLTIELKENSPVKGSICILDVSGKLLQSFPITDKKQRVDINALANGNYFYELIDERGTKFYSGKFSVSH